MYKHSPPKPSAVGFWLLVAIGILIALAMNSR
jgi:hypothetical protein